MGWTQDMRDRFENWHQELHQRHMERHMEMAGKRRGGGHRHGGWFGHGRGFGGNPFGGNPFGGNPFARRTRAKRGDVRAAILVLLSEGPRNGYQVMQELEQRSSGTWRPSPGSVYPAFQQLEDEGLIRAEEGGSGKLYRLTDAGKTAAEQLAKGKAPWESLGEDDEEDEARAALFTQVKQLGLACLQIAHAGNEQQAKEAAAVLNDARKSLYAILAQDEHEGR